MGRLTSLIAGLPRPFNKDPLPVTALTVSFGFGANFVVRNGVLSTVTPSGYPALAIGLRGKTLTQVAALINATANYTAAVAGGLGSIAAYTLLEGQYPSVGGGPVAIPYFTSPTWRILAPVGATLDDVDTDVAEGLRQLNLISATSVWLDRWGLLYGTTRNNNESDFAYARRILLSVIAVKCNGFAIASILTQIAGFSSTITDPAPVVYDAFRRVNNAASLGTAESGQAWTALAGTWGIQSEQAYAATPGTNGAAVIDSTLAGTMIQCQMAATPSVAWRLIFRASDLNNWWCLEIGTATTKLRKLVANAFTDAGSAAYVPVARDVYTVVTALNVITAYRNGTQILTTTDAFNNTATKHGIGVGAAEATARFDFFSSGGQPGAFTINSTITDTSGNPYDTATINSLVKSYKALGTQGTLTFSTAAVDTYVYSITDSLIDTVATGSGQWGAPEFGKEKTGGG